MININQKTLKPFISLLLSQSLFDLDNKNSGQVVDHNNKKEIKWDKTNNKNQNGNHEQGADNFLHNIVQPIITRLSISHINSIAILNISFAISFHKSGILKDLTNDLKKICNTKNTQKNIYNAAIKEIKRIEICIKMEFEKIYLNIEKELGVWRLALEEKLQKF